MENPSTLTEPMVAHYVRPQAVLKRRPFLMAGIFSQSAKWALTGPSLAAGLFGTIGLFAILWIVYELNVAWIMSHYNVVGIPKTPYEIAYAACEFGFLMYAMAFCVTLMTSGRTAARLTDEVSGTWTLGRNPLSALAATAISTAYSCFIPMAIATAFIAGGSWANDGQVTQPFISVCVACFASYFVGDAKLGFAPLIAASQGVSARVALKKSIEVTRGARLKVGLLMLVSHLVWILGYFCLVVPGIPLFEWNQLNLVAVLNRLVERSRRLEPSEVFTPMSIDRSQIFTNS